MKKLVTYLKVKWNHRQKEHPILIYRELEGRRFETRKVEEFRDGTCTYAHDLKSSGNTVLSELPIATLDELTRDPQFEPSIISKAEFERIWEKAVPAKHR